MAWKTGIVMCPANEGMKNLSELIQGKKHLSLENNMDGNSVAVNHDSCSQISTVAIILCRRSFSLISAS